MHPFLTHFAEAWPTHRWRGRSVLVAVSGGADSVALACGLTELRQQQSPADVRTGKLVIAHYNHRLRGEASDEDQRFVEHLAEELGCEVLVEAAPVGWQRESLGGLGPEGAARARRYEFLAKAAAAVEARYVVTAHHRDDQIETVLLRLLRGTGVGGLAGMAPAREFLPGVGLVRPLLGIGRGEILEYLRALGQDFQEDHSNDDPAFARNRMRHRVLPLLRQEFGEEVDQAIARLAALAGECQEFVQGQAERSLARQTVSRQADRLVLQIPASPAPSPYLLREMLILAWRQMEWPLRQMTSGHWHALAELAEGGQPDQKLILPGKIEAQKKGGQLWVTRLD